MDGYARSFIKSAQNNAYSRRALASDSEVMLPTLAHIPGIEPSDRYSTVQCRMKSRRCVLKPHASIKTPRDMFTGRRQARLVHLGKGRVMME